MSKRRITSEKRVAAYFTDDQFFLLEKHAVQSGMTNSAFVRFYMVQALERLESMENARKKLGDGSIS